MRVLYLDNEPEVLEAGLAALARWGCETRGARDEAGAQAAFDGAPPEVMILDYALDDAETGPAVYERLCTRWQSRPPGLLVTAERGEEAERAARASKLDILRKPVAPAALRASLAALKRRIERG